jgi:hypothetical protein
MIDRNEWDRWQADPVTQEVFQVLRERQLKVAHLLGSGACLGNEPGHGEAVGRYKEIDDLLKMEFKDLKETQA